MKHLNVKGELIPRIGQGTMGIGGFYEPDYTKDSESITLLRKGFDLGMTFVDTAELYGGGHSEELVGKAVEGIRDKIFITTKIAPQNLSYYSVIKCAEDSLRRLNTDYIDLYQIHWPNPSIPIQETVSALSLLKQQGKIRHIGVSNFSLLELWQLLALDVEIFAVESEYNLFNRTVEDDILPFCQNEGIAFIAYTPMNIKNQLPDAAVRYLSSEYKCVVPKLFLSWILQQQNTIVIPKMSSEMHLMDNADAGEINLSTYAMNLMSNHLTAERVNIDVANIIANERGIDTFVPNVEQLSVAIRRGMPIKPIVVERLKSSGKYGLIEGKIRYFAWRYAFGDTKQINCLIKRS